VKKLLSHREDATLANLYAPPVRGWEQVAQTLEHASSLRRDGGKPERVEKELRRFFF